MWSVRRLSITTTTTFIAFGRGRLPDHGGRLGLPVVAVAARLAEQREPRGPASGADQARAV